MPLLFQKTVPDAARRIYGSAIHQARQPFFYSCWSIPDTFDGRFGHASLHVILILDHLHTLCPSARTAAQRVFDLFFLDIASTLRETGVSDIALPKRLGKITQIFYGRANTYRTALNTQDFSQLSLALMRTIFTGNPPPEAEALAALTRYVFSSHAHLKTQRWERLKAGKIIWPEMSGHTPYAISIESRG